jgi:dihydropteroate synthase
MKSRLRILQCGEYTLELGAKTLIMGILNATPDSFSDGGRYVSADPAVRHALQMADDGADIIDVGGESTRPGHVPVSAEEELERVIPVIRALKEHVDLPISIDTYKAEVAREAVAAGAHIINDVWGFKKDPAMADVAARTGCPVILMHNRTNTDYTNYLQDVANDLLGSVQIARQAGVAEDRIILDPGIGFVKDREQNLCLMKHLDTVVSLGYPVLLGTSRKRTIQSVLQLPANDVVEGTAATVVLGIAQGCDMMRVHDVKAIKRAAVMADAIVRRHFMWEGDGTDG